MAGEFLTGLQVGANIGNMRAMRLERMMQLKAQEAQQAMQERQINAQVEMLIQHSKYYEAQAIEEANKKIQRDAVARAIGDVYDQNFKKTGDQKQALLATIPAAARVDQEAGVRMSQIYENILQGEKKSDNETPFEPSIVPVKNPVTSETVPVLKTSKGGATLLQAKGKTGELGLVKKEEIKSIYKQIDRLKEQYDTLPDTTGIGYWEKPNEKKLNLKTKIDALKQEAKSLEEVSNKSVGEPDEYVVDKLYEDPDGNKARYRGNGQWEEVK